MHHVFYRQASFTLVPNAMGEDFPPMQKRRRTYSCSRALTLGRPTASASAAREPALDLPGTWLRSVGGGCVHVPHC